MPLYQYHCDPCGHDFDLLRPMAESGKTGECPKCGQESKRVICGVMWKPFPGTFTYDRRNGFVGAMSSGDYKGLDKDLKNRPRIDNLGPNRKNV